MNLVTFYGPMSFFHSVASWQLEAIDTDIRLSREIIDVSQADPAAIWQLLRTSPDGLTQQEANARLELIGPNLIARECRPSIAKELCGRIKNPLNVLLLSLAVISYFLGEISTALMILVIVILAIFTAFVQEHRSNDAAAKLRAMVKTTASVKRKGGVIASELDQFHGFIEIPMEQLVPGDIVRLSAGDMIPADLRLLTARDLFVSQSALTGEAMPTEKSAARIDESADPFDLPNVCFMGGSVVSGYGDGVIVHTGSRTYFGQLADRIAGRRELTSFDKVVNHFTWLMIRFMMVMAPAVFLINGVSKHNWLEALLFAMGSRSGIGEPPPDGALWSSRKVAAWMAGELGLVSVAPQRGWEALKAIGWSIQKPRPKNPKSATPEQAAAFKKSLQTPLPRRPRSTPAKRSRSLPRMSIASA